MVRQCPRQTKMNFTGVQLVRSQDAFNPHLNSRWACNLWHSDTVGPGFKRLRGRRSVESRHQSSLCRRLLWGKQLCRGKSDPPKLGASTCFKLFYHALTCSFSTSLTVENHSWLGSCETRFQGGASAGEQSLSTKLTAQCSACSCWAFGLMSNPLSSATTHGYDIFEMASTAVSSTKKSMGGDVPSLKVISLALYDS